MACFTTTAICKGVGPYGGPTAVTIKGCAVYFMALFSSEVKSLDSDWLARAPPSAPPEGGKKLSRKTVFHAFQLKFEMALFEALQLNDFSC